MEFEEGYRGIVSLMCLLSGIWWDIVSHCLSIEMRSGRSYGSAFQEERVEERQPDYLKVWVVAHKALDT